MTDPGPAIVELRRGALAEPHSIGQLLDWAVSAADVGRAPEFLAAYRLVSEHADVNLGYVLGYVEPPERRRALYEAYGVGHPFLGGQP